MVTFLSLCILGACAIVTSQEAVIQWKYGELHGVTESLPIGDANFTIHKYLGIPFAQPPIGDLRYRKPQPIMRMDSPFYAKNFGLPCVQFSFSNIFLQSEDCLYLNVYVPENQTNKTTSYAVAIWIHGGGFSVGAGSVYDASFMSVYGNLIVVTINYRLGPYGFLSTEDDNAPGNYAFWDQHFAFKWVHDNIGDFGGDNQRVTIFGGSAGAVSASCQALSPMNSGLFQRVIAQSGSAISQNFKADSNAVEDAKRLGEVLKCDTTTTEYIMNCLRNISNEDLKDAMGKHGISPMDFTYIIDDVFIKRDMSTIPYTMADQFLDEVEFYRSLDVMNGFNSHEGVLSANIFSSFIPEDWLMSREQMRDVLYRILGFMLGHPLEESVMEMVMGEYTNWTNPETHEEVRHQFVKLFGDMGFGAPAIQSARMHTMPSNLPQAKKNYVYYFAADPSFGPLPTPEWVQGAGHADEVSFVFGLDVSMLGRDPWEMQLSRKMVTYWTNFMKSGDPNSNAVSPVWPEYNMDSQSYLTLEENTTGNSVEQFLNARETNFWFKVFPGIIDAMGNKSPDDNTCTSSAGKSMPSTVASLCLIILLKSIL